jgi:hypothetical protein
MKLRATIALPAKTSAGVAARVQASGACTAVPVAAGGKINGKKVSVASVSVKASSRTGVCTLVFTSERLGRYAALTKTVSIKVTKTGK